MAIGALRADFRRVYALDPNGHINIHNLYGDVSIVAWDRDEVLVEAVKKSSDPKRLDDAQIVVDSSGSELSIHTQYLGSGGEHPASVEYRITVPRNANLGNVKLINGGLAISGVAGSIRASSVNGSIRADHLEGQAELSTINGQLEAGFNRVAPDSAIMLRSVNGPIRLWIPRGADAVLNARNLSGGIQTQFGRGFRSANGHRLHTIINHGGARIHVDNTNGGIVIRSSGPLT
jgi:DUF4097 and DUF4098 domain-containing protein YvlB